MSVSVIHGFRPTDVNCPYCGASYGALERLDDGSVRYLCWCGARCKVALDPGDEGYDPALDGHTAN